MENEKIKVTVYLSTYNQQEYVAEALDSILMQKTNFRYEIIAADDCSTDDTQKIILEYQKRYPGMIETYFTNPNVGGCKKLTNCIDMGLFRGEYLAFLEGDDYWLGKDRLQTLVDLLDTHPEYSKVSHRRVIIREDGTECGYDISGNETEVVFNIQNFLDGKIYSSFNSVFRNYFLKDRVKYHTLLLASRNVCDFQMFFITQDFGDVYISGTSYGVYRSRSVSGETNYNSITTQAERCLDHIRLAHAVENFYAGKYDLTPMIRRNQKRLLTEAVSAQDESAWAAAREVIPVNEIKEVIPEILYLARRMKKTDEVKFILSHLNTEEKKNLSFAVAKCAWRRLYEKLRHIPHDDGRRGYICEPKGAAK